MYVCRCICYIDEKIDEVRLDDISDMRNSDIDLNRIMVDSFGKQ